MRKLKKALSLVLAIALVLGLCTIGAAAAGHSGEYITVDPYDGPGLKTDLTVKVVNVSGDVLETIGSFETYSTGSTMTISLNSAYYGVYELEGVSLEKGNVSNWSGSFNDSYEITVTWSSSNSSDTMTVTLKEAEHTLKLENNGISLGTIAYKEGLQRTNVNVYLNYEPFVSFEDVHIANSLNNFVLSLNDGYYYGVADNNLDYSSEIPGQTITYTIGNGDGIYNKLTFGVPSTSVSYQDKLNTIDLYMFTYDDGIDVDFTRAINDNPAHLDLANACEKLDISFTYGGNDYTFEYTEWDQTHKAFLPYDTLINVTPDIKPGYSFDCWKTNDAWGDHANSLYTILEDGTLHEETGAASMEGVYAYSESMAFKYASGFTVGQIILKMVTGSDPYTITYHSNIPGNDITRSENFYTGAYIDGNPFTYPGHKFLSWNTAANGTGTAYQPHSFYSEKRDLVLYAQWDDDDPQPPVETVNYTVNYYYDNKLDASKTETGTGTVGETIESVPKKSGAGYCLDWDNLPFELTANAEQNVITVYYATDANDDDIPDSKQVFIKYVSIDTQLGTVSPDMQVETFANGEPTDIDLSSTAEAKSGAEFVNWTDEKGSPVSDKETIDYTLKFPELGKTYTFTANFKTIPVETVTLTYDANGGTGAPGKEEGLAKNTWHTMSTQVPTHQDVNNVKVVFGGWSLDKAVIGQVYNRDGKPTGICQSNQVYMSTDMTVYAVWGMDENGNGIPDFNETKYTVTYTDGADGKVFTDQVYRNLLEREATPQYSGTLTHPDGLSFSGWNPKVSATVTGNATYAATWTTPPAPDEPDAPTDDEVKALLDEAVTIDCVNTAVKHEDKTFALMDGSYKIGTVSGNASSGFTCDITVEANPYVAAYNEKVAGEHELVDKAADSDTIKLKWNDSKWTVVYGAQPVTFDVKCDTPAAPDFDDIEALFNGKVFVDCVEKSWHPTYGYGLLANGYTLTGPVKGADGEYTCTVTLLASAYLAEYNGDVAEKHALASYQGDEVVALKWTGSAWTVINGELPVTFDVVCDTWYPPIIPPVTPSEPVYTPNWLNTTDHVSYIIGYEDGTVKPNAGITRAEVATIFFRLLTDGARERFWSETNAYTDVAAGSWYNIAVSTLSNMGILGGYEDGTFRPNASITRAEFAKIAVSFFDWADVYAVNSFVDVRGSAWYADYVAVAAELGLIEGYGGNVFRPDATITRAEACTIINRTLGRAPDADHLLPVAQMNTWPDNSDTGVWYYAQIQEATNSHDYRWICSVEQWTAKLADPDWDKLQY